MQFLLLNLMLSEVAKLINIVLSTCDNCHSRTNIFDIERTEIISEIHCDPSTPKQSAYSQGQY